jgi:hypothetical protein
MPHFLIMRHANLALLSLVGSMAYGFAILMGTSLLLIEDAFLKGCSNPPATSLICTPSLLCSAYKTSCIGDMVLTTKRPIIFYRNMGKRVITL